MDYYKKISNDFKELLSNVKIISTISKYDVYMAAASLFIILLYSLGIWLGGFLHTMSFYIFLFSLLLCYVNYKNNYLLLGLWGYAATRIIRLVKYFSWSYLMEFLLFGFLGYIVFKKIGEIKLKG